jgi:hypothetical protein
MLLALLDIAGWRAERACPGAGRERRLIRRVRQILETGVRIPLFS